MVWRSRGDIWVISPKVKISLTLCYLKSSRRESWEKKSATSLPLPVSPLRLHFLLLQISPLLKISSTSSFLAFKVCFLEFLHLFFMFTLDDCWWELFKSWEMFYCHEFMFNWDGISRVWSYLLVYMKE